MVRDGELLYATGRGRAVVVGVTTVADLPTPGPLSARKEGRVRCVVRAVAAHVNLLRIGRCRGAGGIARVVEIEGDCAARVARRPANSCRVVGEQVLRGAHAWA